MFNATMLNIAERSTTFEDWRITGEQALALIPADAEEIMDLMGCANKIRQRFKFRRVFKCGIVNAKSGLCGEDCAFCAQSAHHESRIETYGMRGAEELIQTGLRLAEAGATHYSIVTSGTCLDGAELDTVCRAARTLSQASELTLCASLGMLSPEAARTLKEAGITRYHHNLETAPSFFDRICTTHAYADAMATIQAARMAGLEVCSGGIFGMGESWEQRIELALVLRELDVDAIPINFLHPIPGTRLGDRLPLAPLEALACIALFRFVHPHRDITIAGGREFTLGDFQSWIFFAGANGLMVGNYLTTRGRDIASDLEMIAQQGLTNGIQGTFSAPPLHRKRLQLAAVVS